MKSDVQARYEAACVAGGIKPTSRTGRTLQRNMLADYREWLQRQRLTLEMERDTRSRGPREDHDAFAKANDQ